MQPWTVLDEKYLFRRKWLAVREERLRLPGGAEIEAYHVLESPDWTAVVCLTEAGQVVMVEQYRRAVDRASLELPAGVLEDGEAPLAGARRELLEETGYAADDWVELGRWAPEPGRHTNTAHLFFARRARRVAGQQLDESEELVVRLLDPADAVGLAETGGVVHAVHALALVLAARRGLLGDGV